MIPHFFKTLVKQSFRLVGLEVRRAGPSTQDTSARSSLSEVLKHARAIGFRPATVIDVGAAYGTFTRQCFEAFPEAKRFILVEPLIEYEPFLQAVARLVPRAEYVMAVAAAAEGEAVINVHPDYVGSSLYLEVEEGTNVNGVPRTVPAVTLDRLAKNGKEHAPFLLKVDVQGAEMDVLQGAEEMLRQTQFIMLEVSFFKFFKGGPEISDIITFMKSRGFVPYDICGLQYRPLDNALSQVDITFVQEAGIFRQHHYYATPIQRERQNRQFAAVLRNLSKKERSNG
jgi:FkbM family methyltransferase